MDIGLAGWDSRAGRIKKPSRIFGCVWRWQHPGEEFARTRSAAAAVNPNSPKFEVVLPRYAWGQRSGKTGLVRSKVEVEVMCEVTLVGRGLPRGRGKA